MQTAVLYLVACSQVVILYFLSAPIYFRLIRHSFLSKNPEWLDSNPAFARRQAAAGSSVWLARGAGAACLLYFVWRLTAGPGTDQGPDAEAGWLVLYAPMLGWIALEGVYGALAYYRIYRRIPLPARRRASLERRALGDLVNPYCLYPACFLLAVLAGNYLAAWQRAAIDGSLLLARLAGMALCAAAWYSSLQYYLRRKPRPLDHHLGPSYRRLEIIETVLCLYLIGAGYAYQAAHEIWGFDLLSPGALLIAASIALQLLVLAGPRYSSLKALLAAPLPAAVQNQTIALNKEGNTDVPATDDE